MATDVGVGYVTLRPSMRGFGKAIERGLRRDLKGPAGKVGDEAGEESGKRFSSSFGRALVGGSRGLASGLGKAIAAGMKPAAALAGGVFAASFVSQVGAALVSGMQAIAAGAGAGLALLPAALLAGGLAAGALQVALLGVGDALKAGLTGDTEAFNEALKDMSPSARSVVGDLAGLRDVLSELKRSVQESFFAPLVDSVQPLADRYLPIVGRQLDVIAGAFGRAVADVAGWLQLPGISASVATALTDAGTAVNNLVAGVPNLVQAFLPLVTVGASFLPGLTSGFGDLTARVAEFMTEAQRTGQLQGFIQGGLDAIRGLIDTGKQVGRIFGDIGGIFSTVFGASGLGGAGGGLLDTIEGLTSKVRAFFDSASGGELLTTVFNSIRLAVLAVKGPASRLFGTIGKTLQPLLPELAKFSGALTKLAGAVLDVGIEILEPPIRALGSVLGVILPPLTGLMEVLARNKPVLQGIAIAIGVALVPALAAWLAVQIPLAAGVLATIAPLLLLGAAIAGLAALVIIHFDTIKRWISNTFNWVRDNWPLLLAILTGPFGLAVLAIAKNWQKIKDGATAAKNWVVARFGELIAWAGGLPGAFGSAISGLFDAIPEGFKSAINAVIRAWNRLRIPGFDLSINLPGPVPDIGFSWDGMSLPNIPTLHNGGIFRAPGGEGLALLKDQEAVLSPDQTAALFDSPAAAAPTVVLQLNSADRYFNEWIRHMVAAQAGGDVQVMYGRR